MQSFFKSWVDSARGVGSGKLRGGGLVMLWAVFTGGFRDGERGRERGRERDRERERERTGEEEEEWFGVRHARECLGGYGWVDLAGWGC